MTANKYMLEGLDEAQVSFLTSVGFPTFDEYAKNPDSFKETWDESFSSIEEGPQLLRELTKGKHVLSVAGKRVSSIGQMMRVAKDMGFRLDMMTYKVNLENVGAGQYVHHVNLVPKEISKTPGGEG